MWGAHDPVCWASSVEPDCGAPSALGDLCAKARCGCRLVDVGKTSMATKQARTGAEGACANKQGAGGSVRCSNSCQAVTMLNHNRSQLRSSLKCSMPSQHDWRSFSPSPQLPGAGKNAPQPASFPRPILDNQLQPHCMPARASRPQNHRTMTNPTPNPAPTPRHFSPQPACPTRRASPAL